MSDCIAVETSGELELWSEEKIRYIYGDNPVFLSKQELLDMGATENTIKSYDEGHSILKEEAEWTKRGRFGVLPSWTRKHQWEKEHKEGDWKAWEAWEKKHGK